MIGHDLLTMLTIPDRELLGIIRALRDWQHYVQGSPHETIVYSDHKNLTYF